MNENENYINFQNGLLDLRDMKLYSHTPKVFSSIQLPCEWSETPVQTPIFDEFLNTLTSGDKEIQRLILEYIGAILSNIYGYRFKKTLFMVGLGNCGKSVILRLLPVLLGRKNCRERALQKLSERFGATALYMRRLVSSGDLPFMKLENIGFFNALTGGDEISIEYKNKEPFDYVYRGLLWYSMNNLPKFGGDKGSHTYERIIIVKCNNIIPKEKRDPKLHDKLFLERDGIVQKCVCAVRQTIQNGYRFSIPQSCLNNLNEYKTENSLSVEFWNEFMSPLNYGEKPTETSQKVYNMFRHWCIQSGFHYMPSIQEFTKEVSDYLGVPWRSEPPKDNDIVVKRNDGNYIKFYKLNSLSDNI
jgi:P4 family phage/plasmid primase-like protien